MAERTGIVMANIPVFTKAALAHLACIQYTLQNLGRHTTTGRWEINCELSTMHSHHPMHTPARLYFNSDRPVAIDTPNPGTASTGTSRHNDARRKHSTCSSTTGSAPPPTDMPTPLTAQTLHAIQVTSTTGIDNSILYNTILYFTIGTYDCLVTVASFGDSLTHTCSAVTAMEGAAASLADRCLTRTYTQSCYDMT